MSSRRVALAAATGLVIALGLSTRLPGIAWPAGVAKYLGATLWGAMVYGLAALLRPQWRAGRVAVLAACVAVAVEASQLWHAAWLDAFRQTRLGVLLLGRFFAWADIAAYLLGIALAAAVDRLCSRLHNGRPAQTAARPGLKAQAALGPSTAGTGQDRKRSSGMPDNIVIHQKPMKMALLALMAVAMTAVSVALVILFYRRGETGGLPFLMGCIGALFFFGCLVLIVPKIFDRRPAIDVSGEGLLAPAVSPARIAWSDLLAVRFHRYQGQPILELILSEQAERSLPFTRMVTWTRAANRRLGFHGVCLSLGQLERAPEEVAELVGTRLR